MGLYVNGVTPTGVLAALLTQDIVANSISLTAAGGNGVLTSNADIKTTNGTFIAGTGSGAAGLLLLTAGARVKFSNGGTTDYFSSDGAATITAAGSLTVAGTLLATASASHQIGTSSCGVVLNPNQLNLYGSAGINLNHSTALAGARFDARSAAFTNLTLGSVGNAYLSFDMGGGTPSFSRVCGSSTTATAEIGGVLNVNTTAVGNVGASGPDDLITYTLPPSALAANAQGVRITAWGTTANNANAKTVRLVFGGTTLVTKQLTASLAGTWKLMATVVRTGASAQKFYAEATNDAGTTLSSTDGATVQRICSATTAAETDTSNIIIKCQSTVSTSDNDIVNQGLITEWI